MTDLRQHYRVRDLLDRAIRDHAGEERVPAEIEYWLKVFEGRIDRLDSFLQFASQEYLILRDVDKKAARDGWWHFSDLKEDLFVFDKPDLWRRIDVHVSAFRERIKWWNRIIEIRQKENDK
jgi:hypothetical protein